MITTHVTFFKKVTDDFDVDTSTPSTEEVPPGSQLRVADMIQTPGQEQPGRERLGPPNPDASEGIKRSESGTSTRSMPSQKQKNATNRKI